ncbi:hypothetical protein NDN08_005337 [Rhodosorus marinus]|uniref:Uncharacterized protein n=1 Tax=Rhodosorus marinus TaxID=101924 RepID=A0AAV8V4E0_9RHOD|nr:hypothetical protein NDN08_005337 [Rhodosorus marinus]
MQLEESLGRETIQGREIARRFGRSRMRARVDSMIEKLKSLHNDLNPANAKKRSLESDLRMAQFRCGGIEREKISREHELESSRKELERELASVREAFNRSEKESKSCEGELNRNRANNKIHEDMITQLGLALENSRRDSARSTEELKRVLHSLERDEKTERQLKYDLSGLTEELRSVEKRVDEPARSIGEQQSTADNLSQRILDLENALQTGNDGLTQLEAEYKDLKPKPADRKQQIRNYKLVSK